MADELSLLDQARRDAARWQERREDAEGTVARLQEVRDAELAATQNRRGHLKDTGFGILRTVPGAANEAFDLLATFDENMMAAINRRLPDYRIGYHPERPEDGFGIHRLTLEESERNPLPSIFRPSERGLGMIEELIPEPERMSGQTTEALGTFLVGFFTGKKALQGANLLQGSARTTQIANAFAAGAFADMAVFDGHEARLSDLIQSVPALQNPVTEFLASDEDDGELEGRLKNVLEGGGLGVASEALIRAVGAGIRAIKKARQSRAIDEAVNAARENEVRIDDLPARDVPDETPIREGDELVEPGQQRAAAESLEDLAQRPASIEEAARAGDGAADDVAEETIEQTIRSTVELRPEQVRALAQAVRDGNEEAAAAVLKDFNETTFNWQRIENGEQIKALLGETERIFADTIDDVKGGVQSNVQTRRLASQVGASAEEVTRLFRDVSGDQGIAARFYAAQRIMLASAQELRRLGEIAKRTRAPADEARLLHQVQVHAALQAEVKGAQTEIARALQAMSILKESARENFQEFAELKRQFGGQTATGRQFERYVDDILDAKSLEDLNAKVRWTRWERAKMIFIEYTINSMLSSPKTHLINATSNMLNSMLYSADRLLAGSWQALRHGELQGLREARIDVVTKMTRLGEAFRLAREAWRDGVPITDKRQRIEFQTRQAITHQGAQEAAREGDAFLRTEGEGIFVPRRTAIRNSAGEVTGAVSRNWWQSAIATLGNVVRIPGRALITGDEFFKAVQRNAEIGVLSFRQADDEAIKEGLEYGSDAYEAFIKRRMAQLSDPAAATNSARDIRSQAIEKSRLVAFQETPRTVLGAAAERFVNSNQAFKLIFAPFFRTPMNILRQGLLDRTPLGLITRDARDQIFRGTPQESREAIARMTSGVSAMAGAWWLFGGPTGDDGAFGIQVVGRLPYDSSAKAANVKDYSIRLGGEWYQFNRLDPLGMWLGLVADFKTYAHYHDNEEEVFTAGQAAIASFMNNVTNKTWARSFADFMEMSEGISTNRPATVQRAVDRFLAGEFGKLIPQLFKSAGNAFVDDPTSSETWAFMDNVTRQIPGLNQDLPRRHDALGREIPLSAGWFPVFNPFATSETRDDPVDAEMFRLGFTLRPMRKTLGAGAIDLTVEEYSRLTGEYMRATGIHTTLTALVTSDGWENLNDTLKIALLKERITEARTVARAQLLGEPEVANRVGRATVDAALLLTTPD